MTQWRGRKRRRARRQRVRGSAKGLWVRLRRDQLRVRSGRNCEVPDSLAKRMKGSEEAADAMIDYA